MVCETKTLPIRSARKIIQCSPKRNASLGYPTLTLPLVRASIATHETDPRLSDSATSREGPAEIGYANEQGFSAYVRCPTDHQNWHVILPQQGEVIWVLVVIAGMITTGIPFSYSASNRSNVEV